jgi:2-isopropylmalate synthase
MPVETEPTIHIHAFDTIERDGDQAEAPELQFRDGTKIKVAAAIASLGVETIEAGFAETEGDFEQVEAVARTVGRTPVTFTPTTFSKGGRAHDGEPITHTPIITSLTLARSKDIDGTWAATEPADRPGIHIFVPTSDIHIEEKFEGKKTKDDVLDMAVKGVIQAREISGGRARIEFSCEDATRTDAQYLERVFKEVMNTGAADIINLPDTVGYATPEEMRAMFKTASRWVVEAGLADYVTLSTHNHNDLGMATANTVAAIQGVAETAEEFGVTMGAQFESTQNARGERAGNADTNQVVANILTRPDRLAVPVRFPFATRRMKSVTTFVMSKMGEKGMAVPDKAPIVGEDTHTHRSGVHSNGVAKSADTYTAVDPRAFGHNEVAIIADGKYQGGKGREMIRSGQAVIHGFKGE